MRATEPLPEGRDGLRDHTLLRHALFDLDNTLYDDPVHRDEMDDRIERFFQERLSLTPDAAHETRIRYRNAHGTALRGLILHHGTSPDEFLEYVHRGLPDRAIPPRPGAREAIEKSGLPASVFSNAPEDYVERMLRALGLSDLFTHVFGIASTGYVGKPQPEAYDRVLGALGLTGPDCLLMEDMLFNLGPAKARGMATVLLGTEPLSGDGKAWVDFQVSSFAELPDVFRKLGA